MSLDILTFGEALVEVMRTGIGQPLEEAGPFEGPFPSGAPFIFAAQAARLGARVAALGAVGDDAFGRCMLKQLRADGIDPRSLRVLPDHTTGVAFVAYNADGSRDFVFHARHAASAQLTTDMLDEGLFVGLKCLHLMGSTLAMHEGLLALGLHALTLAQRHGAKISFDPNLRPQLMPPQRARQAFAPFIKVADVLLPTAQELALLTGHDDVAQAVDQLMARKPDRIIVITQGADGALLCQGDQTIHVAGFPVQEVDPTGAGDCFGAAFLVRWLAGDDPTHAVRFANACGALAVTRRGPMSGARPLAEVLAFMERYSTQSR
ncbi:MAG: sugar kinase [Anaerolineae bacterium]|nr:sugar kinase [Anaerolineae bacterium]MDW8171187.1 sugar kinase [Anaerolineae bacterium]